MTPTEQVTVCNRDETQEKTSVKAGGKRGSLPTGDR